MTQHCTTLEHLLQDIAHDHPAGLRHAAFVTEVLKSGFVNESRQPLSTVVHQTLKRLVGEGVLVKQEDENSGVREYVPASLACA